MTRVGGVGGWRVGAGEVGGVGVVYFTTPPMGLHRVSARYSALGVRVQG